ncbi:uncharacterized protein LOC123293053 [Chrysoperla carnea]|uniref:uncharacterized protein LOC123293053 n=1 Tax=Chrysoperla carnea TaxID=189513 RepID=UPI001D0928F0|nr:uncharacterized protein LOC123293053 [Chrysoperla carnea]
MGIISDDFQNDLNLLTFELFEYGKDFEQYGKLNNIQRLYKMAEICPKSTMEPWKRSLEDEIFKENLKLINPTIKERETLKVELGCPGDVDYLPGSLKSNQLNKPTFGYKDRTTIQVKSTTPGPGTYGKGHIPDQLYQEKKGQFVSFSNIPEFEKYQCGRNPCKILSLLAPNQYCPVDKTAVSIRLPTKNVSKRGPYDLFTGINMKKIEVNIY